MKKVLSLVLVVVMILGCIGFVACGGEDGGTTPPSNGETVPPSNGETTPPSGVGGFTWNDMPVYPGAEIDEEALAGSPAHQDPGKMEWHCYKTGDNFNTVVDFYKSEMPKEGWQKIHWVDRETTIAEWTMEEGRYHKNDWLEQACVTITDKAEGVVFITLMRASE